MENVIEHWKNLSLENLKEEFEGVVHYEQWVDIIGYENHYQLSNFGRVKSLARKCNQNLNERGVKERMLRQPNMTNGYKFVALCKNGKHKQFSMHRLVAIHFIPNPKNKPEVNHKWGNKKDNRVFALEWSTRSENQLHSYKIGIMKPPRASLGKFGKDHHSSKPVIQMDLDGNEIRRYDGIAEAMRILKKPRLHIGEVCNGKAKTTGGFKWKWALTYPYASPVCIHIFSVISSLQYKKNGFICYCGWFVIATGTRFFNI